MSIHCDDPMTAPQISASPPPWDTRFLFITRAVRLFAYGSISLILVLYLVALGYPEDRIGVLLTMTLLGDTFLSLLITTVADRAVQSLFLAQGALSLGSYCSDIPYRPGRPGYFRPMIARHAVAGPILATQSRFDTAVGRWYPLGAGSARQIDFAPGELPHYGGVGTFGLRGPGLELMDLDLQAADKPYSLEAGRIYNLESSAVICNGGGASGAHNDIVHPEVAHAFWAAVLT
jgi:hypothetical protein